MARIKTGEMNMRKKLAKIFVLFILLTLILSSTTFATVGIEDEVSAYLLGDYETGEILEEFNIYKPVQIASITKLMSYLIIMDEIQEGSISLDDVIYIDEDTTKIKGSSLNLEEGESFTVKELLDAVIVVSANDATYSLAKHVAGTEEDFVRMMNEKAKKIGLKSAIYFNSTGLPKGNNQNMMNSKDIFTLSRYIIYKYPEILSTATIPHIEIPNRGYKKENTNPLLNDIKGLDGLKTGFTNKAGYCLVSTVIVDGIDDKDEDFRLISIVMGTKGEEKIKELGKRLIQYGINNYSKKTLTDKDMPIDTICLPKSRDKEINVYPERNFNLIVKNEDMVDIDIIMDENLKLPLKEMDKVGKVVLLKNHKILDEIDLIVHKTVKREGLFRTIVRNIEEFLSFIISQIIG